MAALRLAVALSNTRRCSDADPTDLEAKTADGCLGRTEGLVGLPELPEELPDLGLSKRRASSSFSGLLLSQVVQPGADRPGIGRRWWHRLDLSNQAPVDRGEPVQRCDGPSEGSHEWLRLARPRSTNHSVEVSIEGAERSVHRAHERLADRVHLRDVFGASRGGLRGRDTRHGDRQQTCDQPRSKPYSDSIPHMPFSLSRWAEIPSPPATSLPKLPRPHKGRVRPLPGPNTDHVQIRDLSR